MEVNNLKVYDKNGKETMLIDDEAEIEKFMMDNNLYIYSKYIVTIQL